jgi:hypothetical protein
VARRRARSLRGVWGSGEGRPLIAVALLFAASACGGGATVRGAGPGRSDGTAGGDGAARDTIARRGWLRVSGPRIVDAAGRPIRLVGMGLSPIHSEWAEGSGSPSGTSGARSVAEIAAHYRALGCNSMRIAFSASRTYDQSVDLIRELGVEAFIDREIAPQVRAVLAQGMFAILDLHRYYDDQSMPGATDDARARYLHDTVIPLWERIAQRYQDEPMIAMYELWNEPRWPGFDVGDPRQIPVLRRWYEEAIRAIRRIDRRHIILVSDHNAGWGSGREQMWIAPDGGLIAVDAISPPQIAYSHHAAALSEQRGENERADGFSRRFGVPVIYGEVELQPGIDGNDILGAQQPVLLRRLSVRLLNNGLCQAWQGWRSGMDEWLDVWRPLVTDDRGCGH